MREDTFGNYGASRDLSNILDEINDKPLYRRVGNIMTKYFSYIKDLLLTQRHTESLIRSFTHNYKIYVNDLDLPERVKTRILNIITAKCNETIKQIRE